MDFKPIKHLFFDLDHTLWDYDRNSGLALEKLYQDLGLDGLGLKPFSRFVDQFHLANLKVWDLFEENHLNRDQLRNKRLELVFEAFDLPFFELPHFQERYYQLCSQGGHLIEGALKALEELMPHFQLHIITNGFDDALENKLKKSDLNGKFKTITSSEQAQSKKPEKAYFEFALKKAGAETENSLVIGDGLRTDVAGAKAFGLPVVWFNPEKKKHPYPFLIEINAMSELPALLLKPENRKMGNHVFPSNF